MKQFIFLLIGFSSTVVAPLHAQTNSSYSMMPHTENVVAPHASPTYLPPEAAVKAVILDSPAIQSTRLKKESMIFKGEAIKAGTGELSVRTSLQQRRIPLTNERFSESSIGLERPIRSWGKSDLDADLSQQMQTLSSIEYSDALHEASRRLMKLWFAHLRSLADQTITQSSLTLAKSLYQQTSARFAQGEISKVDLALAHAELQRAQAAYEASQAQYASSLAAWTYRYPALKPPVQLPPLTLPELMGSLDAMRTLFLANNHELNMMRADAKRLQLIALRMDKERRPDPTIGVYVTSDRGGAERLVGVSLLIPFSGPARTAQAQSAQAEARASESQVSQLEQQLGADFEARWNQFKFKRLAASSLLRAAQEQAYAVEKSRKAYVLGEYSMSDILNINRAANEHQQAEKQMTLDVLELFALLQLDMHQIWDFDE